MITLPFYIYENYLLMSKARHMYVIYEFYSFWKVLNTYKISKEKKLEMYIPWSKVEVKLSMRSFYNKTCFLRLFGYLGFFFEIAYEEPVIAPWWILYYGHLFAKDNNNYFPKTGNVKD